jgi:hypothetical protein
LDYCLRSYGKYRFLSYGKTDFGVMVTAIEELWGMLIWELWELLFWGGMDTADWGIMENSNWGPVGTVDRRAAGTSDWGLRGQLFGKQWGNADVDFWKTAGGSQCRTGNCGGIGNVGEEACW